jgi:hypothetical protein
MQLKIGLDDETYTALMADADRYLRPPDWHVKALLRQVLGLEFPYPAHGRPGSGTPAHAAEPGEDPQQDRQGSL